MLSGVRGSGFGARASCPSCEPLAPSPEPLSPLPSTASWPAAWRRPARWDAPRRPCATPRTGGPRSGTRRSTRARSCRIGYRPGCAPSQPELPADPTEARLRAANYLIAARHFEDARTTAMKVVERDPKNTEALILVGNASAGLNDFDRAIKELQDAQKLDPTDPRIYTNLGWFEASKGRSEQAEAVFRRAIASSP